MRLLRQPGLGLAVMSARCVPAVLAVTRLTLVGDNEHDSAAVAMTVLLCMRGGPPN